MIIDGKAIAAKRLDDLRLKIKDLRSKPKLVAVMVGEDPGSKMYVGLKAKKALEVGIASEVVELPQDSTDTELIARIQLLNRDPSVTGILVQLPFPKGSPSEKHWYEILDAIDPVKDVDCLTSANMGLLALGVRRYYPATVKAVLIALEEALQAKSFQGKGLENSKDKNLLGGMKVCVIGRSDIVGKPLAMALMALGASVTVCNSKTVDLPFVTRQADVLIPATGVAKLITGEMVKPGAIVIDVGISSQGASQQPFDSAQGKGLGASKVVGDVEFESVSKVASAISPVPGGVGPLTVVCLLENTVEAIKE